MTGMTEGRVGRYKFPREILLLHGLIFVKVNTFGHLVIKGIPGSPRYVKSKNSAFWLGFFWQKMHTFFTDLEDSGIVTDTVYHTYMGVGAS